MGLLDVDGWKNSLIKNTYTLPRGAEQVVEVAAKRRLF